MAFPANQLFGTELQLSLRSEAEQLWEFAYQQAKKSFDKRTCGRLLSAAAAQRSACVESFLSG